MQYSLKLFPINGVQYTYKGYFNLHSIKRFRKKTKINVINYTLCVCYSGNIVLFLKE